MRSYMWIFGALFVALAAGVPASGADKTRVCIVLPSSPQVESQREPVQGFLRMQEPANDQDLADVQRSFLKEYTVAAKCSEGDPRVFVVATVLVIGSLPAKGSLLVNPSGTSEGLYTGSRAVSRSSYHLDFFLPASGASGRASCEKKGGGNKAKGCVKEFEKWLELQQQLR